MRIFRRLKAQHGQQSTLARHGEPLRDLVLSSAVTPTASQKTGKPSYLQLASDHEEEDPGVAEEGLTPYVHCAGWTTPVVSGSALVYKADQSFSPSLVTVWHAVKAS